MNFNAIYYAIQGLAYQRGIDSFEKMMSRDAVRSLFHASLETKGQEWVRMNFVQWIIAIVGRKSRDLR